MKWILLALMAAGYLAKASQAAELKRSIRRLEMAKKKRDIKINYYEGNMTTEHYIDERV